MPVDPRTSTPSAPLVVIAGWVLPGAGYWLLGQRARALTVGTSILSLFVLGLLIGGVRVIEVPGYNPETGERQLDASHRWALESAPMGELRDKPWSLPQAMTGPIAILAGAGSVYAAGPDPSNPKQSIGALSHVRLNEIGALYLSVAGLLNLMVIIDAGHRATRAADYASAGNTGSIA